MNRSPHAILLAGLGLAPLALAIELRFFGVDFRILGLAAVFVAFLQVRRGAGGSTTPIRWVVGLSLIAYVFRLIEPWSSEFTWLARISSAEGLATLVSYVLLARSGIALARSHRDPELKRSWQACASIGAPLFLLPAVFVAWRSVSGSNGLRFESHSLLVMMGGVLVLSLPAVLLIHAVFATWKAVNVASERPVRLLLRLLAHPLTAAGIVLVFLTPSLLLVPSAIHFAVTPSFDEFVTHRSAVPSICPLESACLRGTPACNMRPTRGFRSTWRIGRRRPSASATTSHSS